MYCSALAARCPPSAYYMTPFFTIPPCSRRHTAQPPVARCPPARSRLHTPWRAAHSGGARGAGWPQPQGLVQDPALPLPGSRWNRALAQWPLLPSSLLCMPLLAPLAALPSARSRPSNHQKSTRACSQVFHLFMCNSCHYPPLLNPPWIPISVPKPSRSSEQQN